MSNTRELGLNELEKVSGGGWDPGGTNYGAAWAAAQAATQTAPTPAEWKAIGEQISANYIANHSPHLGQPLK